MCLSIRCIVLSDTCAGLLVRRSWSLQSRKINDNNNNNSNNNNNNLIIMIISEGVGVGMGEGG